MTYFGSHDLNKKDYLTVVAGIVLTIGTMGYTLREAYIGTHPPKDDVIVRGQSITDKIEAEK